MQHEKSGVPLPRTRAVVPWNQGRFVGPKPPLKPKQVWAIRLHLQRERRVRDLAMFDLAIDSKLRGCDLVSLRIGQLVVNATVRHRATIIQQKTEQPVQFEVTEQTRDSMLAWLSWRGGGLDD
jgi:site-specific recombinase XerC